MIKEKKGLCFATAILMMGAVSLMGCTNMDIATQKEDMLSPKETETQIWLIEETTAESEEQKTLERGLTEPISIEETQTESVFEEDKISQIREFEAFDIVDTAMLSEDEIDQLFYAIEIPASVQERIMGCSYTENENISLEELSYVRILHIGFDKETHIGELIVNNDIRQDIVDIMRALYDAQYPIERMVLVDEYGGDDDKSMEANNTTAFNYRLIAGTKKLSNHSFGRAIDINPFYNPYVRTASDGTVLCDPIGSAKYSDRSKEFPYKIDHEDLCYQLFKDHGFTWGGDWKSKKDYQHFEKVYDT